MTQLEKLRSQVKDYESCGCANPQAHLSNNYFNDVKYLLDHINFLEAVLESEGVEFK